jgi:hypothetical protein
MKCSSCKSDVVPVRPRTLWKVLTVVFWVAALATSLVFSLLLGLNIVLVPLWLLNGMAVGVAARRMSASTCPLCNAELAQPVQEPTDVPDRRPHHRPLVPRTV